MKLRVRELPVLLLVLGSATVVSPAFAAEAASTGQTVAAATPAPAATPETEKTLMEKFTTSFDVTGASKYLFQGIDYSEGRSVAQPNFVASVGAVSAVVWANYQVNIGDINEVDLSLKATRTFGMLTVSPGYTMLRYPNRADWDPSQELFVDLALEGPLNPTLSFHGDIDAGDGMYATFGLTQPMGPLSAATNVFYQNHYYGMTGVPSVEFKLGGAFDYAGLTLTPSLSRFATTDNGDFTDQAQIPSGWLFSVNVIRAQ